MKRMCKTAMSLIFLAALTAGCQQQEQRQEEVALAEQANLLAAARAELNTERDEHEAEIRNLERQYNDILKQREAELATLQMEMETLKAANDDLRDKIRTVRRELAKLQVVMGPEAEQQ
ncbi:MAG: hypothetical protein JW741_04255 [Sedimentisphaerales bacterium]|nr:hypothetical protein [Sedimentisphaerales bacterium]